MANVRFSRGRPNKAYDLELSVLEALTPHPGYCWPAQIIAEVCGVSKQRIEQIQRNALRKLQVRLWRTALAEEFKHWIRTNPQ